MSALQYPGTAGGVWGSAGDLASASLGKVGGVRPCWIWAVVAVSHGTV